MVKIMLCHPTIKSLLCDLVEYEGLWEGLSLGNFASISSIVGHKNEIVKYLNAVKGFWSNLPQGAQDAVTVGKLELLCPMVPQDARCIKKNFQDGLIFGKVQGGEKRGTLERVLSSDVMIIPTLSSFFHSLRYLGALMPCTHMQNSILILCI